MCGCRISLPTTSDRLSDSYGLVGRDNNEHRGNRITIHSGRHAYPRAAQSLLDRPRTLN